MEFLLRRFDVSDLDLNRRMRDYSHGMKRKLGLIQALMTDAPVLILDEPTSGLDPLMIEAFGETVDELARAGRTTVFLSSHILSEVDRICQRIGLVRGGQLVAVRTLSELRAAAPRRMTVLFSTPVNGDMPALPGATLVTREPARWVLDVQGPLGEIIPRLGASADRRRAARRIHAGRSDSSSPRARPPSPRGFGEAGLRDGARVRSLGRVKILSAALALVLVALQLSIIAAAATFVDSGGFERLAQVVPAFVLQTMGPALTSFRGMVLFAYFDPLIVMLIVQFAIYLATEPAGDVESNLVDLVLARPVPRHLIVTRSLLVMTIGTGLMSGAM